MLIYTNDTENFYFYFQDGEGNVVPYEEWGTTNLISETAILKEQMDNGMAELLDNQCVISNENLSSLSEDDRSILDLPEIFPYFFLIDYSGVINQRSFTLKMSVCDFYPNGNYLPHTINGLLITINDKKYLLTKEQYQVCRLISEYNSLSEEEKERKEHFLLISELKKIKDRDEHIVLTDYINNQDIIIPEKVEIKIETQPNDTAIFLPILPEIQNRFIEVFRKFPFRNHYSVVEDGKKSTVLISTPKMIAELENQGNKEEANKKLELIKSIETQFKKLKDTKITPDNINEILENIEQYFDEDIIDYPKENYNSFLEYFSERVKEIGFYKPKFYPFISPYKSEWIPGMIMKDKVNGDIKIIFETEEVLSDFEQKVEIAKNAGENQVLYEKGNTEIEISVENAENIIEIAKKQLKNPKKPCTETEDQVLIIRENVEDLEFIEQQRINNLEHKFYPISNLREGISLKQHQEEGVAWLQSLYENKCSGGLLADDMGLGKTLQLLYFIEWHSQNRNQENKPYLIVAPVSLLENWEEEYGKFFPNNTLPVLKLYGSIDLTKEKDNPSANKKDAEKLQKKQIILTNYETLRNYQLSIGMVDFAVVALDEAQKIKTPGTYITNSAKALKADFKIAMTGTPVENTLVDIWCIMDFAVSGLLGNAKSFAKEFQNPLKNTDIDIQSHTNRLRDKIGGYIKRRLKIDVAKELPTKHDNEKSIIKRVMPPAQLEKYLAEIEASNNTEGDRKGADILKTIFAIKDISEHPYIANKSIHEYDTKELVSTSAKLQITIDLLDKIKERDEKVIIFAERKGTQRMLQRICREYYGFSPSIINGDTPTSDSGKQKSKLSRQKTINYFHSIVGFNIIIMSPISAGVGLNVIGANHIIHYSRHWNPAKEEQATDRAYRIGQEKEVFVYYPMAVFPNEKVNDKGEKVKSFDEVLHELLSQKKRIASNALFPTEQAEIKPADFVEAFFSSSLSE